MFRLSTYFRACILLGFDYEDRGHVFLGNIAWLSTNQRALLPRSNDRCENLKSCIIIILRPYSHPSLIDYSMYRYLHNTSKCRKDRRSAVNRRLPVCARIGVLNELSRGPALLVVWQPCRINVHCVSICNVYDYWRGHTWLRHCAASRKVASSIPDVTIGFLNWLNPYSRTVVLGWTQRNRNDYQEASWG
jgi:hypothetical protein